MTSRVSEIAFVNFPLSAVNAEATSMMNNVVSYKVFHGVNINSFHHSCLEIFNV